MQDIAKPSRLPQYFRANQSVTVTSYVDMCNMDFIQFHSRKINTEKKTECVVKTQDRSETFVLQGNIVTIHQSLLNSIFTTKLYIVIKKINYKQR
jgi:hypothetical protein